MDRRQEKTKQALREALVELIQEKGFDRITVSDLTRKANINRGTFYLHYQDVRDLRDSLKNEVYEGLLQIVGRLDPAELFRCAAEGKVYESLVELYEYFVSQADFYGVMLGPNGDLTFSRLLKETIETHLTQNIERTAPLRDRLVPIDFIISYMASAQLGFVLRWFQNGCKESPRELASMLAQMTYHGPLRAIGFTK